MSCIVIAPSVSLNMFPKPLKRCYVEAEKQNVKREGITFSINHGKGKGRRNDVECKNKDTVFKEVYSSSRD